MFLPTVENNPQPCPWTDAIRAMREETSRGSININTNGSMPQSLALLIDASPLGRMMGNVYLRIARPGVPTQLFADEAQAVERQAITKAKAAVSLRLAISLREVEEALKTCPDLPVVRWPSRHHAKAAESLRWK